MDPARTLRGLYTSGRDTLAYLMANPGEGAEGDRDANLTHEAFSRLLASRLAEYMPDRAAGGIVGGLGVGNEVIAGLLESAQGRPFYGPKAYDEGDLDANERGIASGLSQPRGLSLLDLYRMVPRSY